MLSVLLAVIIVMLKLFQFPVIAGPCHCSSSSLTTAGFFSFSASFYTLSFNFSCPYPIFSTILLYNKEAVSRTLFSLSASASRVAVTGAYTALYNFEIVFLKNVFIVLLIHFWEIFDNFMDTKIDPMHAMRPRQSLYRRKEPVKTYLNSRWWDCWSYTLN